MFYSKSNPRPRAKNALNIREKPVYTEKIVAGEKTLVKTGKTKNMYEITQSHAEEMKIDNIIRRVALGDVRGLRPTVEQQFIDLTKMPKDYAEALQSMIHLENVFNSLPLDIRQQYNFSKEAFISDFGSDRFARALGIPEVNKTPNTGTVQAPQTNTAVKESTNE